MKISVGDVFTTNNCGSCVVTGYKNTNNIAIEFTTTRYKATVSANSLRKGNVKDLYHPCAVGIGYLGVGKYLTRVGGKPTREYGVWYQMLERCYSSRHKCYNRYGGRGVIVCKEWHNFQTFAEWYRSQNNYDDKSFHLDKDMKVTGTLRYSPETCSLIPQKINNLLTSRHKVRGKYPVGVYYHKTRNKYKAQVNIGGGFKIHLGYFYSSDEAFEVYKAYKEEFIKKTAKEAYREGTIGTSVYKTLLDWIVTPYPN